MQKTNGPRRSSYYELLRYAKTGHAHPGMSSFDKTRALFLFGAASYPETTITGIPPLSFRADGSALTAWSISGNMVQTGTPTPDAPIMPEFVGARTGNLFDKSILQNNKGLSSGGVVVDQDGRIATVAPVDVSNFSEVTLTYTSTNVSFIYATFNSGTLVERVAGKQSGYTISTSNCDALYVCFYRSSSITTDDVSKIMLNTGSTPLPYEPYGYKLGISNAGQTTPIYLGQTQTVRRIKKLVLTGNEDGWREGTGFFYNQQISPDYKRSAGNITLMCTHYQPYKQVAQGGDVPNGYCSFYYDPLFQRLYFVDNSIASLAAFKSYLAAQYAAGTPVCVWYVLAEPETGIVNEPLCKIGDYADKLHSTDAGVAIPTVKGQNTLTVDTELQPSEMTITYRG